MLNRKAKNKTDKQSEEDWNKEAEAASQLLLIYTLRKEAEELKKILEGTE
jgi:hypothetical protein